MPPKVLMRHFCPIAFSIIKMEIKECEWLFVGGKDMNRSFKNYQPAPVSCLLPDYISDANKASELEIQDKAHRLEKALMSYGISAEIIDTKLGPAL